MRTFKAPKKMNREGLCKRKDNLGNYELSPGKQFYKTNYREHYINEDRYKLNPRDIERM